MYFGGHGSTVTGPGISCLQVASVTVALMGSGDSPALPSESEDGEKEETRRGAFGPPDSESRLRLVVDHY